MDILKKYEEENPKVHSQTPLKWEPSGEYSGIIRLVMRLSGGKIKNARQANIVLLIVIITFFGISFLIVRNREGGVHVSPKLIPLPLGPPILIPSSIHTR